MQGVSNEVSIKKQKRIHSMNCKYSTKSPVGLNRQGSACVPGDVGRQH